MLPTPDSYLIADSFEILPDLDPECVDLILTDPPYGIDYQSNRRKHKKRFPKIPHDKNLDWFPEFLDQAYRILKPDKACFVFTCWQSYATQHFMVQESLFGKICHVIIWNKMLHGTGDIHHDFAPTYELILFLTKGLLHWKSNSDSPTSIPFFPLSPLRGERAGDRGNGGLPTNIKRPNDLLSYMRVSAQNMLHPAEKPDALLKKLILLSTQPGDLVFDPFCGIGTTLLSAKELRRRYFGIELNSEWEPAIRRRLNQALLPLEV